MIEYNPNCVTQIVAAPALARQRMKRELALQDMISKARAYTYAREACPIGDWPRRIEEAGFALAQAVRLYDSTSD
jgi:hypothetical protein